MKHNVYSKFRLHSDVFSNIAVLVSEKVFTIAVLLYTDSLMARSLTLEDYGVWQYCLALSLILSSVVLISSGETILGPLVRNKKLNGQIILSSFLIKSIFGLLAFSLFCIYGLNYFDSKEHVTLACSLIIMMILSESSGVVSNYFQAKVDISRIVRIRLIGLILRFIMFFIIIQNFFGISPNVFMFAGARIFEVIVIATLFFLLIRNQALNFSFNLRVLKIVFVRGLKYFPSLVFMFICLRLDRIFAERYFSFESLGVYSVSAQIMEQVCVLMGIVVLTISPKFILNSKVYFDIKTFLTSLSFVICVAMFLFVCVRFFSPYFIDLVYGGKFNQSIEIVNSISWLIFPFSIDLLVTQFLIKNKLSMIVTAKWILCLVVFCISYMTFDGSDLVSFSRRHLFNYVVIGTLSLFIVLWIINKRGNYAAPKEINT